MPLLPAHLHLSFPMLAVTALVPKFYLQSHEEKCHSPFSFNFFKGVRRTKGEGVECNWDGLNGHGPSTAEMLPGHWWETLDDCCRWINFRKTMGLGMCNMALLDAHVTDCHVTGNLLLKWLLVTIPQAIQTRNDIVMLTSSLKAENPEELMVMEQALEDWEVDKTKPDPYHLLKSSKLTSYIH